VGLRCYQVSQQAMELIRDDVLQWSDDPKLCAVKMSTKEECPPPNANLKDNRPLSDVFYKTGKDSSKITKRADPYFPVDYLVIDVPPPSHPVTPPPPLGPQRLP
jgi:hypothetical protein